jgi:hypothetical protein
MISVHFPLENCFELHIDDSIYWFNYVIFVESVSVTSQFLRKNLKILHMKSYHHFMHSFIFAMHNFNLRYYVLLIKSFSVCSDSRGNLLFHKFKIVLNHFGAI